ncbi:MAG: transporter [Hyphomicrobiales bacterium]|nr:transporter [Hyphomicrobiales bacterium]
MSDPSVPGKATRREWLGLAVLALPCFLYAMDLTVLNLAVPKLTEDLKPTATQLLWIVDIYGFMVAGMLIPMGTLGDRIGRRRLLLLGALAFGAASIFAAFASTPGLLILARALLGVAGATIAPSTLSLIRNMFHDPAERTFALSVWGTSYAAGGAVGPVLGGVLLEYFSWGSVFLLAVPVMLLLLAAGPALLPEFRDAKAVRPDLVSAILSLTAVLLSIYGLKKIAEHGLSWTSLGSIAVGVGIAALFVRRQTQLVDPFLDLDLFRSRTFATALGVNVLGCFVVFGAFFYIGQYLQLVLGFSPLTAGLWSLPYALSVTLGSMLAPVVVARFRPALVISAGLLLIAFGLAVLACMPRGGCLSMLVAGSMIFSIGLGPIFVLTTDLMLGSVPPERAGAAASISETGAEFGGVLGIALLGSIGVAIYRTAMSGPLPVSLSAEAEAAARDTLGGAVGAAAALPATQADALLFVARDAFSQSFALTSLAGVIIAVAGAACAWVLLRHAAHGAHGRAA